MTDKRAQLRRRSYLAGRVLFNAGRSTLDCLVRDLSDGGARLEFPVAVVLPASFDLEIPARQETVPAELRWAKGRLAGVRLRRGA